MVENLLASTGHLVMAGSRVFLSRSTKLHVSKAYLLSVLASYKASTALPVNLLLSNQHAGSGGSDEYVNCLLLHSRSSRTPGRPIKLWLINMAYQIPRVVRGRLAGKLRCQISQLLKRLPNLPKLLHIAPNESN